MQSIVRAVDVGYGNTKFVTDVLPNGQIRCDSFSSVAYTSVRDRKLDPGVGRRRTAAVPIDGLHYEVGPEVELAADNFRGTQMHDRFIETPQYLALMRGAMAFMNVPEIDLLVVGLPVSLLRAKKLADGIVLEAVSSMMRWLDKSYSFQNIVLVRGGSFLYRAAVRQAFPSHRIQELKDPLFANVRGFQRAGLDHMRMHDESARGDASGAHDRAGT